MSAEMSETRNAKLAKVGCVCLGHGQSEAQRETENRAGLSTWALSRRKKRTCREEHRTTQNCVSIILMSPQHAW